MCCMPSEPRQASQPRILGTSPTPGGLGLRSKSLQSWEALRYALIMEAIACPHCGTRIPQHASVCVGCGAEIVRGATRQERSAAGCVVALLALTIAMIVAGMGPMPNPRSDAALFLILKFIAVIIVANGVGRLAIRVLLRSKLRFYRAYQHN